MSRKAEGSSESKLKTWLIRGGLVALLGLILAAIPILQTWRGNIEDEKVIATYVAIGEQLIALEAPQATLSVMLLTVTPGPEATAIVEELENLEGTIQALQDEREKISPSEDTATPIPIISTIDAITENSPEETSSVNLTSISLSTETGDIEPNDNISKAKKMNFTDPITGVIERTGDRDIFYFFGESGETYTFDINADIEGSKLDSYIAIWNLVGARLVDNNNDGNSKDSRIQNWIVPENGIYFLVVEEAGNEIGGNDYTYQLSVETSQDRQPDERLSLYSVLSENISDNNYISEAVPISLGDNLTGQIDQTGDVDYYRFDGYSGTTVIVDINANIDGSALDSYVAIWDSNGIRLKDNNNDGYTTDSHMIFQLPKDGSYFLQVAETNNDIGGPNYYYTLRLISLDNPAGPTPTTVAITEEREPNDGYTQANPITIGSNIRGIVERTGDFDYYMVEAVSGESIYVDINAQIEGSKLDSYVAIYNTEGQRLIDNNNDGYTMDSRINSYQFPADGRYYIFIGETNDDQGGNDFFYTLRVQPNE